MKEIRNSLFLTVVIISIMLLSPVSVGINSEINTNSQNISTNSIGESGKTVVFGKHNSFFSPNDGYSKLATFFENQGYSVVDLDAEPTSSDLSDTTILVVNNYQVSSYSASAIDLIHNWVSNGGEIILLGDSGGLNPGIKLDSSTNTTGNENIEYVYPHPIANGYANVSTESNFGFSNAEISNNSQVIYKTGSNSDNPNKPVLIGNRYGAGNVLATTISNLWSDYQLDFADNKVTLENFIKMIEDDNKQISFGKHNSHFHPGDGLFNLSHTFAEQNYYIEDYDSELSNAMLGKTDVLVINTYQVSDYSESAQTRIQDWVLNGGDILLAGDSGGINVGVDLTSSAKLTEDTDETYHSYPHPVSTNTSSVFVTDGLGMTNYTLSNNSQVVYQMTSGSNHSNYPVVIANRYGKGNVLATTISNIWSNYFIDFGDNKQVISNYIDLIESKNTRVTFSRHNTHFHPADGLFNFSQSFADNNYYIEDMNQIPDQVMLDKSDILVVNDYQISTNYSSSEASLIQNWTQNGGNVILLGDSAGIGLGIEVKSSTDTTGVETIEYVYPHPVGKDEPSIKTGSAFGISDYEISSNAQVNYMTTSGSDHPDYPVVLTNRYGQGEVLATTISNLWSNQMVNEASNEKILDNFASFIHSEDRKVSFGIHNTFFHPGDGYFNMSQHLASQNFLIEDINSQLTDSDLMKTDILIINSYQSSDYDTTSINAINAFVKDGGGVIIAGDGGGNLNLGIQMETSSSTSTQSNIEKLKQHPTLLGIESTDLTLPGYIGVSEVNLTNGAHTLAQTTSSGDPANREILVANHIDKGHVLGISASNLISKYHINNTFKKVLDNFVDWVEGNAPSDAPAPQLSSPSDLTISDNEIIYLTWSGNSQFGYKSMIYHNNTLHSESGWDGRYDITINLKVLSPGVHNLTLKVFDDYDRFESDTVIVTVQGDSNGGGDGGDGNQTTTITDTTIRTITETATGSGDANTTETITEFEDSISEDSTLNYPIISLVILITIPIIFRYRNRQ